MSCLIGKRASNFSVTTRGMTCISLRLEIAANSLGEAIDGLPKWPLFIADKLGAAAAFDALQYFESALCRHRGKYTQHFSQNWFSATHAAITKRIPPADDDKRWITLALGARFEIQTPPYQRRNGSRSS